MVASWELVPVVRFCNKKFVESCTISDNFKWIQHMTIADQMCREMCHAITIETPNFISKSRSGNKKLVVLAREDNCKRRGNLGWGLKIVRYCLRNNSSNFVLNRFQCLRDLNILMQDEHKVTSEEKNFNKKHIKVPPIQLILVAKFNVFAKNPKLFMVSLSARKVKDMIYITVYVYACRLQQQFACVHGQDGLFSLLPHFSHFP